MNKVEINKHAIEFYDGAEYLPMKRYQRFNKYLLIDNEVGSDFTDFELRSSKAVEFLKKGLTDEAIKELENRRMMVFNSFMEYSPRGMALALLVHKIDNVVYKDISSEGLQLVLDKLDEIGFTEKQSTEKVDEVKKKFKMNWDYIFLKNSGT